MASSQLVFTIYARRSSDSEDRQSFSIKSQLEVLRELARKHELEVATELTESASARNPGRPIFTQLMRQVKAGKVQGILVWRLDRLARNMVDGGELIYALTEGTLKEIVTPEATYTGAGDSKFMLAMLFGAAAKYTDDLSAAVRRGNQTILRKGKVPGPVPLGYLKTHEHELAPGAGTVIPDPERFDTVKRVWTEVLGGISNVSEVWRKARYEWGLTTRPTKGQLAKPIALTNLYAILHNPFYTGQLSRGGESFKGEQVPMITREQFERAQEILGGRRHPPSHHTHDFLYQGLLHCGECTRLMTGERHVSSSSKEHVYYRCGRRRAGYIVCKSREVREEDVTEGLAELFEHVIVDPQVREWAFEAIAWWAGEDEPSPEKLVRRAKAALARSEQELVTMTDLVVDGLLTEAEYRVRRTNQLAKINHLREALAEPVEKLAAWKMVREDMQQHGLKIAQEFATGDEIAKRRIVTRTCSDILIFDRKPRIQLRSPFVLRETKTDLQSGLPQNCHDVSSKRT